MTTILDGKSLSKRVIEEVALDVITYLEKGFRAPSLAVVMVGDDPASAVYVRNKIRACKNAKIDSHEYRLPSKSKEKELLDVIKFLNDDSEIDAILIQLPLPKHIKEANILREISPEKDVDGFHPLNTGNLFLGRESIQPCTPKGIMMLFEAYDIPISGKNAVVIGRSNIVGKPVAHLLLQKDATVTICHSKTDGLKSIVKNADIVISAVGKALFVKGSWIKDGATVIDVGMNEYDGGFVGDVDFEEASEHAEFITPVPGGVGPMTIASLMLNTLSCYKINLKNIKKQK